MFAWTLFSFALLCAIFRSQVDQEATMFTPFVCSENRFEMNCSDVHSEADSIHTASELLSPGCSGTDLCAEQTIKKRASTLKALRNRSDLRLMHLNVHCSLFTGTAVSALSSKFKEIRLPLILNCYFYTTTNELEQNINTSSLRHTVCTLL